MEKIPKFFIYVIPFLIIAGGLFIILLQGQNKEEEGASLDFLDYKKLEELAQKRPNGENYLKFIRDNEAILHDADPSNDADAFITMGFNIYALGDPSMAVEAYTQGLRLAPDNSYGLNNIASAYMDLGEFEKAEEMYRKLTNVLSGDSSVVMKHLQVYDLIHPGDEKGFLKILKEGLAVASGDHLATLLSYAGSYFRDKGNKAKAVEYFEKLIKAFPDNEFYRSEFEDL